MDFGRDFFRACADVVFPRLCLHCHGPRERFSSPLCTACSGMLDLAVISGRCPCCFSAEGCDRNTFGWTAVASAFDAVGPAATLFHAWARGDRVGGAKDFSAFLLLQWEKLNWPMPECIVPIPELPMEVAVRGYSLAEGIAKELARLLDVPLVRSLRKRRLLPTAVYDRRGIGGIGGQTVLSVAATLGQPERECGRLLREEGPASLFLLTVMPGPAREPSRRPAP